MMSGPCQIRSALSDEGYTSRHHTTVLKRGTKSVLLGFQKALSYFLAIDTTDQPVNILGSASAHQLFPAEEPVKTYL